MELDEGQREEGGRPVLEYQSAQAALAGGDVSGTLAGTIGIILLLMCLPLGSAGWMWGLLALVGSLIGGAIQVGMSFYRVQVGNEKRVRVRTGSLVLGLVPWGLVLAILSLLPALGRPHERAQRVKCASNLRHIGQGIALYRDDYRVWPQTLGEIFICGDFQPEVFTCPSSDAVKATGLTTQAVANALVNPKHCSYIYFPPPASAGDVDPATVLAVERMENHDGDGMNILFGDGHVEWCSAKEAQRILDELKAGHNPPRLPATQPTSAR